eukprot:TRINITY_DN15558_c0_g5_i1.p1 TRINITY_DN15558_c0_g5~~TRINITY_DN15558_c0_g5_i1.p1  ORF type:complete len:163 (-),score=48.28 TRINITY_DN15558_c0_g5_i1:231-719(-)
MKAILELLFEFGLKEKMHCIQFVNNQTISDLGGGNTEEQLMSIRGLFGEMECYPKSLLIFDIDSLCPSTKRENSFSKDGEKDTHDMRRIEILDQIVDKCKNLKMTNSKERMCWVVLLVNHENSTSILKNKLDWPSTPEEKKREKNKKINSNLQNFLALIISS